MYLFYVLIIFYGGVKSYECIFLTLTQLLFNVADFFDLEVLKEKPIKSKGIMPRLKI